MILAEGYWHGEEYIPEIVDDPWANLHAGGAGLGAQHRRPRVCEPQARRPRAGREREASLRARRPQRHAGQTSLRPHR